MALEPSQFQKGIRLLVIGLRPNMSAKRITATKKYVLSQKELIV